MMRLALAVFVPATFLGILELALRVGGYGYPTSFFIPTEDGRHLRTNRQFGWRFYPREAAIIPNPVLIRAEKEKDVRRIFILGESAAAGTPDPSYGFGRILEVMLRQRHPEQKFEIVNAAMRGVDSHIIHHIARECAQLQPDLFILYAGNNEFVGSHAPSSDSIPPVPHLRLLRTKDAFKATKLGQLAETAIRGLQSAIRTKAVKWDMDFFRRHRMGPDDRRKKAVYDNFRRNLADILEAVRGAGGRAIVSTVGVNLKDFPPLGSLHKTGLPDAESAAWSIAYAKAIGAETNHLHETAIRFYDEAERIDACFADLHFRIARCYLASGQIQKAREKYLQARDCDALSFRADSTINEIIRRLASNREAEGIHFADVEQALAEGDLSGQGIAGDGLFRDHVHFTFDGDYVVARRLLPAVTVALGLRHLVAPILSRNECAETLAYTSWAEVGSAEPIVKLTAGPPFLDQLDHAGRQSRAETLLERRRQILQSENLEQAKKLHQQAVAQWPNDWQLHYNFGRMLRSIGDARGAAQQFERTLQLFPKLLPAVLGLGYALLEEGRVDLAFDRFAEAFRIDPNSRFVREGLALVLAQNQILSNRLSTPSP